MKIVSLKCKNMDGWMNYFPFSFLAFWSILGCIQCCLFTRRWWIQNEETPSHISHLPFVHLLLVSVYWSLNWPQDLIGSLLGHLQRALWRGTQQRYSMKTEKELAISFFFILFYSVYNPICFGGLRCTDISIFNCFH